MPNTITGSTDSSDAFGTRAAGLKSALIVAVRGLDTSETITTKANEIMPITSTLVAATLFGSKSKAIELTRILIANGVTNIEGILVDEFGEGKTYVTVADAYNAAFVTSLIDRSIKCIVLDTYDQTVVAKLATHLIAAEGEDMWRYSVSGQAAGATNDAYSTAAAADNNSRIFMVGPNAVDDNNVATDGIYIAAGVAGAIMTQTGDPALPMNGVEINGFGGIERPLLTSEKTALINAGVTPIDIADDGNPMIFRLVTTYTKDLKSQADLTWQEGTTRFIADNVLESVENELRSKYKRTKNVARILDSIKGDVIGVLTNKNDLEIIRDFDKSTVSVIVDPNNKYGALVDYVFKVVTPLYAITIKQHMKI